MSNMNNTGSLDNLPSAEPEPIPTPMTPRQRGVSLLFLVGVAALLALALFAGFHLVSILYGVIYPPMPPIYALMTQTGHENRDYGVDVWDYMSTSTPRTRNATSTCTSTRPAEASTPG